jgi:hypothetical protein
MEHEERTAMSDLLEPRIAELLRAERAHPAPSAAAKARVMARIQTTVGTGPSPSSAPSNAPSASSRLFLHAGLGSLVAAAAVGSFVALRSMSPSIPAVPSAPGGTAIALESATSAVRPATAPPTLTVAEPPSLPMAEPSALARAGPVATASSSGATDFAAERPLLERARAALLNRNPASALAAISLHARRFPHGSLSEERDALRVEALVAAHRYDDARAAASRFHATYPGSMLTAAVDAALGTIP